MDAGDIFPKARLIAVLSRYSKENLDKAFQMDFKLILETLQRAIPSLSAVYVFGSQATGDTGPESDLDLAILADTARCGTPMGSGLSPSRYCRLPR